MLWVFLDLLLFISIKVKVQCFNTRMYLGFKVFRNIKFLRDGNLLLLHHIDFEVVLASFPIDRRVIQMVQT